MYYISSYKEDEVSLKGTKLEEESKKLSFEELEEFVKENTVIGYNPVTKKLSVKTLTDVENYLNSKLKLTGVTTDDGIKILGTAPKVNSKVYYTHEIEGKTILVAEPFVEYEKRVENNVLGEPCKLITDIKLTMPVQVEENVDVIRLNWVNIIAPAVQTEIAFGTTMKIIIDFPFTPEVIGFNPMLDSVWLEIEDIVFTDNFSMKGSRVSKTAFDITNRFKSGEIVQTEDGYKLLLESKRA